MQEYLTGQNPNPGNIEFVINDVKRIGPQTLNLSIKLAELHRGITDFEYKISDSIEKAIRTLNNISIVMIIISFVALVTGICNIINVMLSSISERIRDIGVQRALGANSYVIFIQFVLEAVILSLAGGMIGILMGIIPLLFKNDFAKITGGWGPELSVGAEFLALCVGVFAGIVSGLIPAFVASYLKPSDALRYE